MILLALMAKEEVLETKISILKEVADTIVSTNNIESITNLVLDLALSYTRAKTGSILLLNAAEELIVKAARGMDPDVISALRLKIGENICGKVALERKPLLVKDIESEKRILKKVGDKYRTKSFICCPILMKDKLLGVINISDKADGTPFTEDELDLISILANQAAITLENARLMVELRSKSAELDETNKGLIEADRVKTEFIARMSHEIRTPLNSINGAIHYLKEKRTKSKAEQSEFIEIISDETIKLITLLDGLLDFSRFDKEEYLLKKRIINLNEIIRGVFATKNVKQVLKDKKLSISQSIYKQLPSIIGDRTRIFQLFVNLLEGIIKYTKDGDVIDLKTSEVEPAVEVELLIKNRKFPESELSSIFDSGSLWSWMDTSPHNLKFYLAKKTVEIHKGTISAQNTPEGLSIKFLIPKSLKEQRDVEIHELMDLFASFTAKSMTLNTCSLMLTDELTGELTIKGACGLDEEIIRKTRLRLGDQIAGWVALEKKPLLVEDIEKSSHFGKTSSVKYNTKSLLSVPIIVFDQVIGVLNLNNKDSGGPFNKQDLYLAVAIAARISSMLEKLHKGDLKEREFKIITRGMDDLLRAEEKYKKENKRIIDLVFHVMKHLGCNEDEISLALYTSVLYDLGLTHIDSSILEKDKKLTALEQRIIRTHPVSGTGLIEHMEFSDAIKKNILYHHERYDGLGYPEGLKGEEIPLISRVLAVIDTYIAMTSNRPYRKAVNTKTAIEHINSGSGTQFDPNIVVAFNKAVKK
jgi:HD-GYP domain-containing protein (c-di-GMP phosphodiesterase class II)/nitrogen-specific signal transduction histidine kinase